jgi:hypothetical protein
MLVSWGGGRLKVRFDLALRAYLLFFYILKLGRAALLNIDTFSWAPKFSCVWSLFSSVYPLSSSLFRFS